MKHDEEDAAIAAMGPTHARLVRIYHELFELEHEFHQRGDAVGAKEVLTHRVALWMLGNRLNKRFDIDAPNSAAHEFRFRWRGSRKPGPTR